MPVDMAALKVPTDSTYGDLADGETIHDKSGNAWVIVTPTTEGGVVSFSLASTDNPTIPVHVLTKPAGDAVKVLRRVSQAEEVEQREAEMDAAAAPTPEPAEEPTPEESVAAVEEGLGGEVIAEETVPEREEREEAAASGEPMQLPEFEEFTDLEKRSHLYLVHGVYAQDVRFREALVVMHKELHDDPEKKFIPHEHVAGTPFPTEEGER